jgi:hypothetical protein
LTQRKLVLGTFTLALVTTAGWLLWQKNVEVPMDSQQLGPKPFVELPTPRPIHSLGLPDDLTRFYAMNEGVGLESNPERLVRLCKLTEVQPITWKDLHIFGREAPPKDWENFAGYRIGISSFFDEIVYVTAAPVCPAGSIMTIGVDVDGPGGKGGAALQYSLVLAASFDEWMRRLREYNWMEYGLVPGSLDELSPANRQALVDVFRRHNPEMQWTMP